MGNPTQEERKRFSHLSVFDSVEAWWLAAECAPADYAPTAPDDPAYLIFNSGSTAEPKGVLHAHRVVIGRRPMHRDWLGLGEDDIVLHAGNINWTYTLGVGVLDPWACGATGSLYTGVRDPTVWLKLIEVTRTTIFAAAPGSTARSSNTATRRPSTYRACVTESQRAKRFRPICSPTGMTRWEPGFTRRWA